MTIVLLLVFFVVMATLGVVENALHSKRLRRIPYRIHVSGTRGKSSVTRLIAGALREAGIPTAAKTTGTLARMILPDGRELAVFRPLGANILEQLRIVQAAARMNAQVLVVECMALKPSLHWVSERKMIRATHGVITNARADHLEIMGPDERAVAACLAGMTPVKGTLFTAERAHLDVLSEAAKDRGSELVAISSAQVAAVTEEEMSRFGHEEHAENVALALQVVGALGVSREVALAGMWKASPDPGALAEHKVSFFGRELVFVNGFAANDPTSTEGIWRRFTERYRDVDARIALFNMRSDRPHRTLQMAAGTDFWHDADWVVVTGSGTYSFGRKASVRFDSSKLIFADEKRPEEIFEHIIQVCGRRSLIVGMGNIASPGLEIASFFKNRSQLPSEVSHA